MPTRRFRERFTANVARLNGQPPRPPKPPRVAVAEAAPPAEPEPPAAPVVQPLEMYTKGESNDGWARIHVLISPEGEIQPTSWSGLQGWRVPSILAQKAWLDTAMILGLQVEELAQKDAIIADLNRRLAAIPQDGEFDEYYEG